MAKSAGVRGFKVPCVRCSTLGTVQIDASDVSQFTCTHCEETFDTNEVREILDGWTPLLAWLETAPLLERP